jgi:hypothetical protein
LVQHEILLCVELRLEALEVNKKFLFPLSLGSD